MKGLLKHWWPVINPVPRLVNFFICYHSRSAILTCISLIDIVLELQVQRSRYQELWLRIKRLDDALRHPGEFSRSECTVQVIRNGHHMTIPWFLVVKGDINCAPTNPSRYASEPHGPNGREWKVLESPMHDRLLQAFRNRHLRLTRFEIAYNIFISIGSILLVLLYVLFDLSARIILPIVILTLPLCRHLLFLYCNTRMHLLSEALYKSVSPYDDGAEIDEFDEEALPPTKDLYLSKRSILYHMLQHLLVVDDSLFWNYDLATILGTVTYLLFLDKKHLLSYPEHIPDQVVVGREDNSTLSLRVIHKPVKDALEISLDLNKDDLDSKLFKAIGLGLSISANCLLRFRADEHYSAAEQIKARLCPCSLARAFGFRHTVFRNYRIAETALLGETVFRFVTSPNEETTLMFAIGELADLLSMCGFLWTGSAIAAISPEARANFEAVTSSIEAHGLSTLALSCRPCRPGPSHCVHKKNHIFLGFIIFSRHPRNEVPEFIHDLGAAGIKFVYFSRDSEVETKALGSRLGLETDWNSCILFSAPPKTSGHLSVEAHDFSDPKSKLPRGVHNVRPHLLNVDDIPLRLSLFAECDPASICEMVKIYQENDEIAVAVGMAGNLDNLSLLSTADLGIVMDMPLKEDHSSFNRLTSLFTSVLSPIRIPAMSSPYMFTELIREARTLFRQISATLYFLCVAQLSIFGYCCCGGALNKLFPLLSLFVVPALTATIMVSDYETGCMKQMAGKTLYWSWQ